jgi:hypothetical protein
MLAGTDLVDVALSFLVEVVTYLIAEFVVLCATVECETLVLFDGIDVWVDERTDDVLWDDEVKSEDGDEVTDDLLWDDGVDNEGEDEDEAIDDVLWYDEADNEDDEAEELLEETLSRP